MERIGVGDLPEMPHAGSTSAWDRETGMVLKLKFLKTLAALHALKPEFQMKIW